MANIPPIVPTFGSAKKKVAMSSSDKKRCMAHFVFAGPNYNDWVYSNFDIYGPPGHVDLADKCCFSTKGSSSTLAGVSWGETDPDIVMADMSFVEVLKDQQRTIASQQATIAAQQETISSLQLTIQSLLG